MQCFRCVAQSDWTRSGIVDVALYDDAGQPTGELRRIKAPSTDGRELTGTAGLMIPWPCVERWAFLPLECEPTGRFPDIEG